MPTLDYNSADDDDLSDIESPDETDLSDDEDSVDTITCPSCRREIYEQAEMCPHCGQFIVHRPRQWPKWLLVGVVACVIAAYLLRGGH